ncbi:hypothetical protein HDU79_011665 [Rhizoclosmatium sp. JEL0117]|nr:hypothetical protein HDU79_011665 [Rhizoclosmatium sp. JEL0117]
MADAAIQGKKRGRKPANEEPANKKIALQRAAARAFRERKEKYVHDLEETVKSLSGVTEVNQQLRLQLEQLERENAALRQSLSFRSQSNLSNSDTSSPSPLITPQHTVLLHDTPTQPVNLPPISNFTFNMGISHQSIPLQYDTFVDLRPNLDINPTVFSPELIALLNAPLPVEPTPSQIIRPHFERLRVGFFSLRCLANDGAIVDELFDRLLVS